MVVHCIYLLKNVQLCQRRSTVGRENNMLLYQNSPLRVSITTQYQNVNSSRRGICVTPQSGGSSFSTVSVWWGKMKIRDELRGRQTEDDDMFITGPGPEIHILVNFHASWTATVLESIIICYYARDKYK